MIFSFSTINLFVPNHLKYFNLEMSQTHRWGVPDAAGGADAAGLSDTFLYWGIGEYIFCIGGMLEKNYLKFSQIFSNLHFFCKILQKISGVPDAAGLSDTFLVLEILVEKNYLKLSLFFSNFLKFSRNTFLCIGNGGKLSQIISFFLKFSQIISKFLICLFQIVSIFSTKYLPQMMGSRSGGGYR